MNDPEITLPLRDRVDAAGAPVHEFVVAGHNDDFALEVDGLTLVGRLDPERGPAQAIAVEAPLELVDGALKVTGVPENVQELLDRIVEAIAGEPANGRTYGRKDREWQEATPIVREHAGRTLDEPTLIVPQIAIGGGADNNHLTRNAVLAEGVWRYAFDGPAFAVSASDGVLHFNTAANGEAGAEITWGAAVQIGLGGGVTTTGGLHVGTTANIVGAATAGGTVTGHNGLSAGNLGLHTSLGGEHWYAFHWNGNVFVNINNATGWLQLTNQCDERLKQDIAPTRFDCLAAVEKIPLYQFRWRDNSTPGDIKPVGSTPETLVPIGLVAQRVEEVAPSLIVKPPAPPATAASDAPFNPMQIDTNTMFAVLIGAIQQLAARVEQLETRA
jgi:Chaperone of endosialidase